MKLIGCVGTKGALLPGLRNSDELINAGIFHQNHYDEIIEINQDEAIDKLSILVNKLGILSGPSGGASYACALKYLQKIDQKLTRKHKAVFIVCDRLEPYTGYLERFRPDIFGKSNKNGVDFSKLSDNDYNSVQNHDR
jgi:cysteine synthase